MKNHIIYAIACLLFCLSIGLLVQASQAVVRKELAAPNVLVLSKRNTVVLRGMVTTTSVTILEKKMKEMSEALSPSEPIYLVLDTPGGDVDAGLQFIDFVHALPNKVKTLTLFAASMGFQIVQNLDERLIIPSGTLMSHRGSIDGLTGQVDGDFEQRLKNSMNKFNEMDLKAAQRMRISLGMYKQIIHDELWLNGNESVQLNAADKTIVARCDSTLNGESSVNIGSFLGVSMFGKMSNCPLITGITDVSVGKSDLKENRESALEFVKLYSFAKSEIVKKYIVNGNYSF